MRILISTKAEADLFDIYSYLHERNPTAAEAALQRINQKFEQLSVLPFIGRVRTSLAEGLRNVVVGTHVIFYLVGPDALTVVRVIDGRRDIDEEFRR